MHWDFLITNLMNGLIALVLLLAGYKTFDLITPKLDFYEELKQSNYAVAILLSVLFICLSFIVGTAAY